MTHSTLERDLLSRLKDLFIREPNQPKDIEKRIDIEVFTDSKTFEKETNNIIKKRAFPVTAMSNLLEPGDLLTTNFLNIPLIAVRNSKNRVKVFYNICRHRGAQLCHKKPIKNCRSLKCGYHGWTYNLDGDLVQVPEKNIGFPQLNFKEFGLKQIPCHEKAGVLWACLDPEIQWPDALGPLATELDKYQLSQWKLGFSERATYQFNWKIGVHAFLEGYHFGEAHRNTASPLYVNNVALIDNIAEHTRITLPRNSFKKQLESLPDGQWKFFPHVSLVYFVFPSTFVFQFGDHLTLIHFHPLQLNKTEVRLSLLVPHQPQTDKEQEAFKTKVKLFKNTVQEDIDIAESIQRGLNSPANDQFVLASFENSIFQFQRNIQNLLP